MILYIVLVINVQIILCVYPYEKAKANVDLTNLKSELHAHVQSTSGSSFLVVFNPPLAPPAPVAAAFIPCTLMAM